MKLRLMVLLFSACLMLALSVLGVTRAVRASAAYFIYNQAKYGRSSHDAGSVLAKTATAYRFYPYNYYFCIWAAERSYFASFAPDSNKDHFLKAADYWCDKGLLLNPYKRELRMLKARLLGVDSPSAAVAYWGAYVDWHYWDPFNHSALAEFHALAGDFDQAFKALDLIKGMRYHQEGLALIQQKWRQEMEMPSLPSDLR